MKTKSPDPFDFFQLLASLAYPDSTGSSDTIRYSYNRQGQKTTLTDQRGCVHTFEYDKLGRQTHDRVTTVGSGVDDAVLRLSTTYEVRGMVESLTSWNNANVASGDAVNQCLFAYNNFGQLTTDYQEHGGEVNTSSTPKVQYGYADGSDNTIRQLTLTYPNGRVLTYGYGTTDGIDDAVSRIASLIDDDVSSTHLADYSFVGQGQFVVVDYTEPDVKYTLVNLAGTNDPDTGDIYSGWDRFGRVKDCRWYDYGNSTDVARLKYGYDRASDRLWRADLVAHSLGKNFDELYSYDGMHRLKDMQRGLLNGTNTAITNETFAQCWSLDPTSNWHGFREAVTGGSWTLDQSRSANEVNEITDIANTVGSAWVTPAYDAAGNTTTIPQPADPTKSYTGTYDAWNRLVSLTDDATDDAVQTNQYDPRHFRTIRTDYTLGVLATTRHSYFTFGWQGIEERTGTSTSAERQFVWGQRYIDDLVIRDRDTDATSTLDERLYTCQDANWNTVTLFDTSATAQERYLYSPFGWPTFLTATMASRTSSAVDNTVLFTGQRFEAQTHFHLFRMRWFDAHCGRFFTRDPLGYQDGMNVYAGWFVISAAIASLDPSGMKCVVCGARTVYRVALDALDKDYEETPFSTLAASLMAVVNRDIAKQGLSYPLPILNTGEFFLLDKTTRLASIDFLFFVVFDIRETKSPPGTCRIFLDERGTSTQLVQGGQFINRPGHNEGDITGGHDVVSGVLKQPYCDCDKSLIFGDVPGTTFTYQATKVSKKLRQKIVIRDSMSGDPVYSTNIAIDFGVDSKGVFTPEPDYKPVSAT